MAPLDSVQAFSILVLDTNPEESRLLQDLLVASGHEVALAESLEQAQGFLRRSSGPRLAIVALDKSTAEHRDVLEQLRPQDANLPVLFIADQSMHAALCEALALGAADFITRPIQRAELETRIARLAREYQLRTRVRELEERVACSEYFQNFVYVSRLMRRVAEHVHAAAADERAVFLLGEPGTGKKTLASVLHASSAKRTAPFLTWHCGSLSGAALEAELFGLAEAPDDSQSLLAIPSGTTVLLDAIHELPRESQSKLHEMLQSGVVPRPGGRTEPLAMRVIATSTYPVSVLRSEFLSEELLGLLMERVIDVPPLRAHPEDIPALVPHFASRAAGHYDRRVHLDRSAMEFLRAYPFPGNVRELENLLETVTALSTEDGQVISEADLRPLLSDTLHPSAVTHLHGGEQGISMERLERLAIQHALHMCRGNRTRAAAILGISRDTLYRKLRQLKGPSANAAAH